MTTVARSEALGCSNPKLVLGVAVDGKMVDAYSAEFTINFSDGSQVYPGSGRAAVDTDDCPTGHKLSTGRYAASWTVASDETYGRYEIRWYYTLEAGGDEHVVKQRFEVQSLTWDGRDLYALIQDLRDEGFTSTVLTDSRALELLADASQQIDDLTGQWFNPRYGTVSLDGANTRDLRFEAPVIGVEEIRVEDGADGQVVDADAYRVYARHLGSTRSPDDRVDPRVELTSVLADGLPVGVWSSSTWALGEQNVYVDCLLGFTDPPGPVGETPRLIRKATMLLVRKNVLGIYRSEDRSDEARRNAIRRIKTRDQEVEWDPSRLAALSGGGYSLTGDPEVDNILMRYMAPIYVGST